MSNFTTRAGEKLISTWTWHIKTDVVVIVMNVLRASECFVYHIVKQVFAWWRKLHKWILHEQLAWLAVEYCRISRKERREEGRKWLNWVHYPIYAGLVGCWMERRKWCGSGVDYTSACRNPSPTNPSPISTVLAQFVVCWYPLHDLTFTI